MGGPASCTMRCGEVIRNMGLRQRMILLAISAVVAHADKTHQGDSAGPSSRAAASSAFLRFPAVEGRTSKRDILMRAGGHRAYDGPDALVRSRLHLSRRGAAILLPTLLAADPVRVAAAGGGEGRKGLDKSGLKQDYDRYSSSYEELDGGAAAKVLGVDQARPDPPGTQRQRVFISLAPLIGALRRRRAT